MATTNATSRIDAGSLWVNFASDRSTENRNRLAEVYYQECKKIAVGIWRKYKKKVLRFEESDWVSECLVKMLYIIEKFDSEKNNNFTGFLYLCLRREFRRWMHNRLNTETLRYADMNHENGFKYYPGEDFSEETEQKLRLILGNDYIDSRLNGTANKPNSKQKQLIRYAMEMVA